MRKTGRGPGEQGAARGLQKLQAGRLPSFWNGQARHQQGLSVLAWKLVQASWSLQKDSIHQHGNSGFDTAEIWDF